MEAEGAADRLKKKEKPVGEFPSPVPRCPVSLQLRFLCNALLLTSIHHSNPQQFTGGNLLLPDGDLLTSEVKAVLIHATEAGI